MIVHCRGGQKHDKCAVLSDAATVTVAAVITDNVALRLGNSETFREIGGAVVSFRQDSCLRYATVENNS